MAQLLFDFDGTLVDSAPGILESMRAAFTATGLTARIPMTELINGLPLRAALVRALGADDLPRIARLEAAFREHYDGVGHRGTRPYPGIPAALDALRAAGHRLHIVTNKRLAPTQLILAQLQWDALFDTVNTLDSSPGLQRKSEVVARLLSGIGGPATATMIGDTEEDAAAALDNGLPFVWVRWGYGREARPQGNSHEVTSVAAMLQCLLPFAGVSRSPAP
ncbi:MAG TPA: HAD family hydrolase [Steroidobacteraceae bacterium]|nr:HAD family hydrolase [Steroidobacteraceae bacterium]